jgi:hypothetical protein
VIDLKNWRHDAHRLHRLSMADATELLSYLQEIDAETQGAIRSCRNRVSTLKDLEILQLRAQITQLKKSLKEGK